MSLFLLKNKKNYNNSPIHRFTDKLIDQLPDLPIHQLKYNILVVMCESFELDESNPTFSETGETPILQEG
jgi:hypothetical protein